MVSIDFETITSSIQTSTCLNNDGLVVLSFIFLISLISFTFWQLEQVKNKKLKEKIKLHRKEIKGLKHGKD